MDATKKTAAIAFIHFIRSMDPAALNELIVREAGEELAQFFLNYSANLIAKDPSRVLENTSSLMLMGYMIRAAEEGTQRPVLLATLKAAVRAFDRNEVPSEVWAAQALAVLTEAGAS